jgi:hypothetical protein
MELVTVDELLKLHIPPPEVAAELPLNVQLVNVPPPHTPPPPPPP